ncbi:riboflavin kinase [Nesidiocoris tenuis]|uniref:riboflavin kinase n=1 Tax=Nesidiocoris tenuis TaxID=355587 RepID=A0ABN7ABH2_9HEMI|nr:riboflavin kinase [Nesidiocoris tenuis]
MNGRSLPLFVQGTVTRGFGRGSKELGCPTANYSQEVVKSLPQELDTGIYCGWASIDHGLVHKMVMSVGWNPFYNGKEKTMEVHILHEFPDQFYGAHMRVCVLKYLRPEMNFNSVDELIAQIKDDVEKSKAALDVPELAIYQKDAFFTSNT